MASSYQNHFQILDTNTKMSSLATYTLRKFWRSNKIKVGKLVPLENQNRAFLGEFAQANSASFAHYSKMKKYTNLCAMMINSALS